MAFLPGSGVGREDKVTVIDRSLRSWPGSLKAQAAKQVHQLPEHPGHQGHELLSEGFTSRTIPQGLQDAKCRITPRWGWGVEGGGGHPVNASPKLPLGKLLAPAGYSRPTAWWMSSLPEKPIHLPTLPTPHTNKH